MLLSSEFFSFITARKIRLDIPRCDVRKPAISSPKELPLLLHMRLARTKLYLNLELRSDSNNNSRDFGRIIFYTDDVDELYSHLKNDDSISTLIFFENESTDALWGERFFHVRDPDGNQLSFAMPIKRGFKKIK